MILCLDIGNSHIFGGVFRDDALQCSFRYPATTPVTSDQFGLFLKGVIRENALDPSHIDDIAISSVVPSLEYSVNAACIKYFSITPLQLKPGIKTGIKLKIKNTHEIGADRIANAIAAVAHFPHKNVMIIDFGTATTVCAINANKEYLGGAIMPGIKISMDALHTHAARLAPVDIVIPTEVIGTTTESNIQSGLYYSQLGGVSMMIEQTCQTLFNKDKPIIIATGGYAHLFQNTPLFDVMIPDLALQGLRIMIKTHHVQRMNA
ncbi:MAG: pantothenate kinase [Coxiella sp. (in: Bacteria)]|nr:MAG: pantothenate kinase [Coxiella sp. (in: g-proteobacteria)]